MTEVQEHPKTDWGKKTTPKTKRRLLSLFLLLLVLGSLLFLTSGQLNWAMAWIFLIAFVAGLFVTSQMLGPNREDLSEERHNVPEGAKSWDKILSNSFSYLTLFITLPVAGLDRRFGWSTEIDLTIQIIALFIALGGYGLIIWAMVSNRFFSRIVRIQKDRGHAVITSGPYRYVRHPGYVGMLLFALMTPLTLDSLWALTSGGLAALITLLRTALEDTTLQKELEGYEEYSKQVRFRLIPGVW
jgi:protein-S-isoprenylcysteine O-methyltransferase Ste14